MGFLIAAWIVAGVIAAPLSYGMTLAYFQREYPYVAARDFRRDSGQALFQGAVSLFVPVGAILVYFMSGGAKHGLMFRQ